MKRNKWWVLLVSTSGPSVVFLDNTIMPVALPTIEKDLYFTPLMLVWVVNSYLLSLTAFLLIGGRLCDLFGKRRMLITGLVLFGLGSSFSGFSMTQWWMLLGRVIQGIGGACIVPTTVALIMSSFPQGERAKAMGINTGISSIFLLLGPGVGGLFTQYFNWRWIFFLNIPLVIFGIWMAFVILSPNKKKKETFHFMGAIVLLCAAVTLVVGLMQGNEWGWTSPATLSLLLMSPFFFAIFWWISTHAPHPLIDFKLFKNRRFTASNIFIFLTQSIIMVTVIWAIYFQNQLHYSPAKTGLVIFIAVFPVFMMAPLGGYISDRYGPRRPILIGFSLLTFALFWLLFMVHQADLGLLMPGLICFGSGIPLILSPTIAMGLSEVDIKKLGAASGITTETRQLASTIGIALMSTIYYSTLNATGSNAQAFSSISLIAGCLSLFGLIIAFFTVKPRHREEKKKQGTVRNDS